MSLYPVEMVLRIPFCSVWSTHSAEGDTVAREELARVFFAVGLPTLYPAAVRPNSDDEPLLGFGPESDERRTR
jgi:hypothetical protein